MNGQGKTVKTNKESLEKGNVEDLEWKDDAWVIQTFRLKKKQAGKGAPAKPMFRIIAEKLPFEALPNVEKSMSTKYGGGPVNGVYVAHDSVGQARYIGRGNVFSRLKSRQKRHPLELLYFSIYVISDKTVERQIETALIHIAGPTLLFNNRKKRTGNETHNPTDFESGTIYYERKRIRKKTVRSGRRSKNVLPGS